MASTEELTGNIAVFTAVRRGNKLQRQHAQEVGRLIGEHGFGLVYGGIDSGLMHDVSASAHAAGARVVGVVPTPAQDLDLVRGLSSVNDELVPTPSLAARKHTMLKMSDAVITLAGGIGTFDELLTVIELSRGRAVQGVLSRLAVVNTEGFYNGLHMQLERMYNDGLVNATPDDIAEFVDTPQEAIAYIRGALPQGTTT